MPMSKTVNVVTPEEVVTISLSFLPHEAKALQYFANRYWWKKKRNQNIQAGAWFLIRLALTHPHLMCRMAEEHIKYRDAEGIDGDLALFVNRIAATPRYKKIKTVSLPQEVAR